MTFVFALPLLLLAFIALPLWWHLQRQRRRDSELFSAAQFLPATKPQQQRIWRWQQRGLLLTRIALIALLAALLSDLALPWRDNTTLVSVARFNDAPRNDVEVFCATPEPHCDIVSDDLWLWLAEHEREWPTDVTLRVEAYTDELTMPARRPEYVHTISFDLQSRRSESASTIPMQSSDLVATRDQARVWPSASLRSVFLLFIMLFILLERGLAYVGRR